MSTTYKWNGAAWATAAALSAIKYYVSGCGSTTDALCIGGYTGATPGLATTEKWASTAWSTVGSLNQLRWSAGCVGVTSAALVFGGTTNVNNLDVTEKWNGSVWTTTTSLNVARKALDGMGSTGSALSIGGNTASTAASGQVVTELWSEVDAGVSITFTDPSGASLINLKLIQDAAGNQIPNWPGTVQPPVKTLDVSPNAVDNIRFYFDGTNYWDDTTDAIEDKIQVFQSRSSLTTSLNSATPITIGFDNDEFKDDIYGHSTSVNNSVVQFKKSGLYRVTYNISTVSGNGFRDTRVRIRKNGITYLTQGTSYGFSRNNTDAEANNHVSVLLSLSAFDYIELMGDAVGTGTAVTMIANESTITIELIRYV